ncbi:MAG: elongation factor P [Candidatus Zambryskibacteria bacterium]|nr:elongation factor P [Candidatus Zambryskibacteria bacterium]
MLEYNQITIGKIIIFQSEPWQVIASHVFRKQQRKPVNATKLKNLITGRVTENSFHQSEKAEEAEIEKKDINFIYENKGEYWFHEVSDKSKRFSLTADQVGTGAKFLKQNTLVKAIIFDDPSNSSGQAKIIGVELPIKMDLKVVEAPPAIKGNTAQGGNKVVKVETGTSVNAPLFINEGDIIRINTQDGSYVERV